MIITHTEAVRGEAIEHFRLRPDRVHAVPLAAAEHFRPVRPSSAPAPYFLYVGALEPRKNLDTLLEAWRGVRRRHAIELRLAGRVRNDFVPPVAEPGLRLLGEVPEDDLPGLYSGAVACLYPSLYEGFGLPVLEAMQCGALVLASRTPAIAEVAGGAALLLDARDVRAWTEAMNAAVTRAESLAVLRSAALKRARMYCWARTARLTYSVYAEALRRFRG
jgi:glycosyltransferase involved in cell wall biosynthesis